MIGFGLRRYNMIATQRFIALNIVNFGTMKYSRPPQWSRIFESVEPEADSRINATVTVLPFLLLTTHFSAPPHVGKLPYAPPQSLYKSVDQPWHSQVHTLVVRPSNEHQFVSATPFTGLPAKRTGIVAVVAASLMAGLSFASSGTRQTNGPRNVNYLLNSRKKLLSGPLCVYLQPWIKTNFD